MASVMASRAPPVGTPRNHMNRFMKPPGHVPPPGAAKFWQMCQPQQPEPHQTRVFDTRGARVPDPSGGAASSTRRRWMGRRGAAARNGKRCRRAPVFATPRPLP